MDVLPSKAYRVRAHVKVAMRKEQVIVLMSNQFLKS